MAWNAKKIALVAGGTVVGGAACFLTAGAAAPAVGAFIGSTFMGLSGAAATSAGLAALGGGALAAGGGGMAAGAAAVGTAMATSGAVLGALGMGTVANFFQDSNKEFEEALNVQKDFAKAQRIIRQQEAKVRDLRSKLDAEKARRKSDKGRIARLEKAVDQLAKVVSLHKDQLRRASGQHA